MTWLVAWVIISLVAGFVWYRLKRTNIDVPPSAERALSEREALRFRLDNGLPIKSDAQQDRGMIGHNGGPPLETRD